MVLSSPPTTDELVAAIRAYLDSSDVLAASGEDNARVLRELAPVVSALDVHLLQRGARAIAQNQHNAEGSKGGASWLARLLGVSENWAGRQIGALNDMDLNPDVLDLAVSGKLSWPKAKLVAVHAKNTVSKTEELLAHAQSDSYEQLSRRGHDLNTRNETSEEERERLNNNQHVMVREKANGNWVVEIESTPENSSWIAKWKQVERDALRKNASLAQPLSAGPVLAKAFDEMMLENGGSVKTIIVYHLDIAQTEDGLKESDTVYVAGLGRIPTSTIDGIRAHSDLALLIKSHNAMLWYSEKKYNPFAPVPESLKRAKRREHYDTCKCEGCVAIGEQVDHILAETNGGTNAWNNLQLLCWEDHAAKTKIDAPWTAGGIYGKRDTG